MSDEQGKALRTRKPLRMLEVFVDVTTGTSIETRVAVPDDRPCMTPHRQ
jgi:hypothetical protein